MGRPPWPSRARHRMGAHVGRPGERFVRSAADNGGMTLGPLITSGAGVVPRQAILVADEDRGRRLVTGAILARAGFTVLEAAGALEALEVAGAAPAALAVLDVELPDLDTFELCRRLLHLPAWARTPVVFTTDHPPVSERRQRLEALGFVNLVRPFRAAELLAAVGDALATGDGLAVGERGRWQVLAGSVEAASA